MADINPITPVATGIQPPQQMSLGDMMNFARQGQAYQQAEQMNPLALQQAKQQARTGQIALTVEEQKDIERRAMQTFFSEPANFQTDGRIDINKINAAVPKLAPLTGPDYVSKMSTLSTAQTEGLKAKQNLTQDQRQLVGSTLGLLGRAGVNDPQIAIKELQMLVQQNPDNVDLKNLIEKSYVPVFEGMQSGAHVSDVLIKASQSMLTPTQQQATFAPQTGTLATGAEIKQTTTTPGVGTQAPKIEVGNILAYSQLPPGSRMIDTGTKDLNNNSIFNVFDANGRAIGQTTVPAGVDPSQLPGAAPATTPSAGTATTAPVTQLQTTNTPISAAAPVLSNAPVRLPAGPTAAEQVKAGAEVAPGMRLPYTVRSASQPFLAEPSEEKDKTAGADYRNNLVNAQIGLPQARRNTEEVMKSANEIADQLTSWEKQGGFVGNMGRKIRSAIGSDKYDLLAKDLAQQAITQSKTMGSLGVTVGGLDMTSVANGTTKIPPDVLVTIAKRIEADRTNMDMQANGAQKFFEKFGDNNQKAFIQAWNANAKDTRIFEAMNVLKNETDPQKMTNEFTKLFPKKSEFEDALLRYQNLKSLEATGVPIKPLKR